MKFLFPIIACLVMQVNSIAQISGNQVYKDRYRNNSNYNSGNNSPVAVIVKDSIMLVSAKVLFNVKPDSLIITLGLSQEAKTVKDANTLINKRLNAFRASIKQMGISDDNVYVDFITQTKIYDYSLSGNTATQFIKGFEIKKNVILTIPATSSFDKIIELASESEIYDIVKVDYINSNTQIIYTDMMKTAGKIIQQKKENYLVLSPVALQPIAAISSEKFYAVYPGSQYQEYQAFETSDITQEDSYSKASLIKRVERKGKTFYYDRIDQSDFDQVVNNSSPIVGIQYVLEIQLQYKLK